MIRSFFLVVLWGAANLIAASDSSDFNWPNPSPPATLVQEVGELVMTVRYERPAARERIIFGGLVPFGEVWRTGAGYCTRLTFSQDVRIAERPVAAGTYSLFTIPERDCWTIIINRDTSLYGAYKYEPARDVLRLQVPVARTARFYESFTIDLDVARNDLFVYLTWADTQVGFPISTGTTERTLAHIEQNIKYSDSPRREHLMAADFLMWNRLNPTDALQMARYANATAEMPGAVFTEAAVLENMGLYRNAIQVIQQHVRYRELNPLSTQQDQYQDLLYADQQIKKIQKRWDEVRPEHNVFVSSDEGQSFRPLLPAGNDRQPPAVTHVLADEGGTLWAATQYDGLWEIPVGGRWQPAHPAPVAEGVYHLSTWGGSLFLSSRNPGLLQRLGGLRWLPVRDSVLRTPIWVAHGGPDYQLAANDFGLFRRGKTGGWQSVWRGAQVRSIAGAGNLLLASTPQGVIRSEDGGRSWVKTDLAAGNSQVRYTGQEFGVLEINGDLRIVDDSGQPSSVLKAFRGGIPQDLLRMGQSLYLSSDLGLYRSDNDGVSWQMIYPTHGYVFTDLQVYRGQLLAVIGPTNGC